MGYLSKTRVDAVLSQNVPRLRLPLLDATERHFRSDVALYSRSEIIQAGLPGKATRHERLLIRRDDPVPLDELSDGLLHRRRPKVGAYTRTLRQRVEGRGGGHSSEGRPRLGWTAVPGSS